MTRILACICALIAVVPAFAQLKEGKVTYERTIQLQIRIQGMDPSVANNMPRSRTDRFELSFTPGKQLWEALPDMEEGNEGGPGGGGMFTMRFGNDELVYTNLESSITTSKQELAGKSFIVTDTLKKLAWKLSDEQKEIMGLKARKATATRIGTRFNIQMENGEMKRVQVPDTTVINAWFTPEIPVAAGPEFSTQLPGLILELEMNKGRVVYKAVEISPKVKVDNIKEPKGGKAISAADFAVERNKMMEEMRRNFGPGRGGPGGSRQIIIQGN